MLQWCSSCFFFFFLFSILRLLHWGFCVALQECSSPMRAPGCKNRLTPFPGRMLYKATKPGSVYRIFSCYIIVLLFIRAPFYVLLVFVAMCSVFWLFWLSCKYLPSDWLETPLWGSLTVARGSSPLGPGRRELMFVLVYCILSLFNCMIVVLPYVIYFLLLWHDIACLCWKCRKTPTN